MAAKCKEIELVEVLKGTRAVDPEVCLDDLLKLSKDTAKLEEVLKKAKGISILIIGKTGTGKSTLINGLVGEEVADTSLGLSTTGVSLQVESYLRKIGDVDVKLFDSPGLGDGAGYEEAYLTELYEKCKDVDMVIFAIKNDCRFVPGNADAKAMVAFTKKFGVDVWRRAIVIITCCDLVEQANPPTGTMTPEQKKVFFKKYIDDYKKAIHNTLIKDACVPENTVKKLKVVPTGHESNKELMDGTLWFSNFWFECLTAISTREARVSMLKLNTRRMRTAQTVTKKDFSKPLTEQPIVIGKTVDIEIKKSAKVVGTVLLPAFIFGVMGAAGLAAGPVGAMGIPLGVFVGLVIGAILAANNKQEK